MCGIAGYYGDGGDIYGMLDTLSHRGPDDRGVYSSGKCTLGHNRLSIVDLSKKGRQPMRDSSGKYHITYNGEIYNFKEVRRQLSGKYRFLSETDTEVILYSYIEWGEKCLQKIRGMFSFVIYDEEKDLLFGARDRLGEKPLKYFLGKDFFVFASEVKSILPFKKHWEIDYQAIARFLVLQYVPSPFTGFKGIYKLPPAHYFIYKNSKMSIHRYWDVDYIAKVQRSENDWIEEVYSVLDSSVNEQLYSDAPLGAFLSGGIDSSLVVALAAKHRKRPLKTFSIGIEGAMDDETKFAEIAAEKYKTDHTVRHITKNDMLGLMPQMYRYYDEPLADHSILPTYFLAQVAAEDVKVSLGGDGGDELFGGYERYKVVSFAQRYALLPNFIHSASLYAMRIGHRSINNQLTERALRFTESIGRGFEERYPEYGLFIRPETLKGMSTPGFSRYVTPEKVYSHFSEVYTNELGDVDNALCADLKHYLPDALLYKTDTASMAHSLELRSPFLDYRLVELSASMPSSLKVKNFRTKYLLKKMATRKALLPSEIVNRRKQGFNLPINSWLKSDLREYVYDTIFSDTHLFEMLSKEKVQKYVDTYYSTNLNYGNSIFSLMSLSSWLSTYF